MGSLSMEILGVHQSGPVRRLESNPRMLRTEPYTAMAAIALCKPIYNVVHTLMRIVMPDHAVETA